MPYVLLGVLTLGSGLGAGLGLSEGPVTYDATQALTLCIASVGQGSEQILCTSKPGAALRVPGTFKLAPASPTCLAKAMRAAGRSTPANVAGLKRTLRRVLSTCESKDQPPG